MRIETLLTEIETLFPGNFDTPEKRSRWQPIYARQLKEGPDLHDAFARCIEDIGPSRKAAPRPGEIAKHYPAERPETAKPLPKFDIAEFGEAVYEVTRWAEARVYEAQGVKETEDGPVVGPILWDIQMPPWHAPVNAWILDLPIKARAEKYVKLKMAGAPDDAIARAKEAVMPTVGDCDKAKRQYAGLKDKRAKIEGTKSKLERASKRRAA